jgi:hypothetical protein
MILLFAQPESGQSAERRVIMSCPLDTATAVPEEKAPENLNKSTG